MKKIDRRSVMKSLATLPMASFVPVQDASLKQATTLKPGTAACPPNQLCIKFHGVWGFISAPGRIVAVTPCVEEHSYWVGNGTQTQHLLRGKYHLDNVAGAAKVSSSQKMIQAVDEVDLASSYLWMVLPFPKTMAALGQSSVSLSPPVFPLSISYLFQYDSQDSSLILNPGINVPKDGEFHIRAEQIFGPGEKKDQRHLQRAVQRLIALFPQLNAKPIPGSGNGTDTGPNPDVCGAQFLVQTS